MCILLSSSLLKENRYYFSKILFIHSNKIGLTVSTAIKADKIHNFEFILNKCNFCCRGVGIGMVASPSSSLNTPVGASVASPGGEEAAYREKVRQLSKYIEPLRRMVHRMVSEGESEYWTWSYNIALSYYIIALLKKCHS